MAKFNTILPSKGIGTKAANAAIRSTLDALRVATHGGSDLGKALSTLYGEAEILFTARQFAKQVKAAEKAADEVKAQPVKAAKVRKPRKALVHPDGSEVFVANAEQVAVKSEAILKAERDARNPASRRRAAAKVAAA